MGRTALQTNMLERAIEPHDDAERRHRAAALRRKHILAELRACRHAIKAMARSGVIGIDRPLPFCRRVRSSMTLPTWPLPSATMSQVRFAISPARKPALADNNTISRLRRDYG